MYAHPKELQRLMTAISLSQEKEDLSKSAKKD
jgi:hypothetical protein